MTDGHIVAVATASGIAFQAFLPVFRKLWGRRFALHKMRMEEAASRENVADHSYTRLKQDYDRLAGEVDVLRRDLEAEREEHQQTKDKLERVTTRCEQCERWMRLIGRRGDVPPPPDAP